MPVCKRRATEEDGSIFSVLSQSCLQGWQTMINAGLFGFFNVYSSGTVREINNHDRIYILFSSAL